MMRDEKFKYQLSVEGFIYLTVSDSWVKQFNTIEDFEGLCITMSHGDAYRLKTYQKRVRLLDLYLVLLNEAASCYADDGPVVKGELTYEHGCELFKVSSDYFGFERNVNISATSNLHILCDLDRQFSLSVFVSCIEGAD